MLRRLGRWCKIRIWTTRHVSIIPSKEPANAKRDETYSSSNHNIRPSPTSASTTSTGDNNIITSACNSAASRDVLDGQVSDGDSAGGGSSIKISTVVVLLDEDAVFGDGAEGDAAVGNAGDGSGVALGGLDADSIDRGLDLGAREGDVGDGVVGASTD